MDPEFQRLVTKEAVSESDSSDNEARQDAEDEEFRKELAALPADVRAKILAELGEVEEAAGGSDAEASSDDDDEQDDMEEGSHIDVMGINLRLNEFGILPGRPHALEWIETLDHTWTDSCAERITNVEDEPAREAILCVLCPSCFAGLPSSPFTFDPCHLFFGWIAAPCPPPGLADIPFFPTLFPLNRSDP